MYVMNAGIWLYQYELWISVTLSRIYFSVLIYYLILFLKISQLYQPISMSLISQSSGVKVARMGEQFLRYAFSHISLGFVRLGSQRFLHKLITKFTNLPTFRNEIILKPRIWGPLRVAYHVFYLSYDQNYSIHILIDCYKWWTIRF